MQALDDQTWSKFQDLGEILSSEDGFQRYKTALTSAKQFVPFIGVHIGDLRFIQHYNKSHSIYGINETKVVLLSREFSKFALFPVSYLYLNWCSINLSLKIMTSFYIFIIIIIIIL
jgi:hypothetical protein